MLLLLLFNPHPTQLVLWGQFSRRAPTPKFFNASGARKTKENHFIWRRQRRWSINTRQIAGRDAAGTVAPFKNGRWFIRAKGIEDFFLVDVGFIGATTTTTTTTTTTKTAKRDVPDEAGTGRCGAKMAPIEAPKRVEDCVRTAASRPLRRPQSIDSSAAVFSVAAPTLCRRGRALSLSLSLSLLCVSASVVSGSSSSFSTWLVFSNAPVRQPGASWQTVSTLGNGGRGQGRWWKEKTLSQNRRIEDGHGTHTHTHTHARAHSTATTTPTIQPRATTQDTRGRARHHGLHDGDWPP